MTLPVDPKLAKLQSLYDRTADEHKKARAAEVETRHKEDEARKQLYDCIRALGYCPHCEARLKDCLGHLLHYTQVLLAIISRSVACSQHHAVSQRLARWLLTIHDRTESNELEMPHTSIATVLGVRRVGITMAAGALQAAGLISYRRAHIRILDALGLEKKSCECYRFIKQQIDSLHRDVPKFLSSKP